MTYARDTKVAVAKTRGEIEDTVAKYGARFFASANRETGATIMFEIGTGATRRRIMFEINLPPLAQFEFTAPARGRKVKRTPLQQRDAHEQACRSHWRALLIAIKAKLVSVDSGIETVEEAFLAQVVVPGDDGRLERFGKVASKLIAEEYGIGKVPGLQLGSGL